MFKDDKLITTLNSTLERIQNVSERFKTFDNCEIENCFLFIDKIEKLIQTVFQQLYQIEQVCSQIEESKKPKSVCMSFQSQSKFDLNN